MEEKILIAAENQFVKKGFKGATTTAIAKEAGCNQALVHYYFRTKDKLFEKVFQNKVKLFADSFFKLDHTHGTFEERMRVRIASNYDIINENPGLLLFVIQEVIWNPERVEEVKLILGQMIKDLFEGLQKEIDEEVAKGAIRAVESVDLFLNILSLCASMSIFFPIVKPILNINKEEMDQFVTHRKEVIIETILNSLRLN